MCRIEEILEEGGAVSNPTDTPIHTDIRSDPVLTVLHPEKKLMSSAHQKTKNQINQNPRTRKQKYVCD